jgi:miniconductance mechanosensitive channel
MMTAMGSWLESWTGISSASPAIAQIGYFAALVFAGAIVYIVARVWIVGLIRRFARRSQSRWDDALVNAEVFVRLAHFAPALVAFYGVEVIPGLAPEVQAAVQRASVAVMVIVAALSVGAFLSALNEIYASDPENRTRPIKGYLQVIKLVLYLLAGLSIVSVLLDKSPWIFLSGIGALSAVLLLIFKDTILSLVASIQITSNNMVHVGDWVEMPRYGADGDVIDVALHTVKIQNWDKTITTIPTHALIADSFKNWRGMSESGGRRIKRSLYIDVNSIRFLEPEEVERFSRWSLLREYVTAKKTELEEYNARIGADPDVRADFRSLTNVGTLRAYIRAYLRANRSIHEGMTLLVRQLQPGPEGLPIELYCFTNETDWGVYEEIQSDLFDHILAIVPEFDLRVFQNPTGADFEHLAGAGRET